MARTTRTIVRKTTRVPVNRYIGVKRARTTLYPYSRTIMRRRRIGGGKYSYGVTGTNRFVRRSYGRDIPLYLPPRPRRYAEVHAFPQAEATTLHDVRFTNTGSITHLNVVGKGDSLGERQGDRIFMLRILLRGFFRAYNPGTEQPIRNQIQVGTFMLVWDRQPTGALPLLTDILDTAEVSGLQRMDTRDRFFILYRYQFQVEFALLYNAATSAYDPVATADSVRNVDWNIPVYRPAVYATSESSGAIANVRTGALYAVFVGGDPTAVYTPSASLHYRISFSDSQ